MLVSSTFILFLIQSISITKDFLSFDSHLEVKIEDPVFESIRMPSFNLCHYKPVMSETQLNDEINKWNKTEYSFLQKLYYSLIGKNFSLKKIECDVEIEFYGINDKMNKSCSKLEENAIKETYLISIYILSLFRLCVCV